MRNRAKQITEASISYLMEMITEIDLRLLILPIHLYVERKQLIQKQDEARTYMYQLCKSGSLYHS